MSISRRQLLGFAGVLAAAAARRVQVIAHRGEHIECPENTIPAIERAIAVGADWVELDVRTTRDGKHVLMHNATVDATTDGKGAVAAMDFAEIARLDAAGQRPKYKGTRVPTFEQALGVLSPSQCGLYLDAKQITAEATLDHLRRFRMLDRCVVYGSLPLHRELQSRGHGYLSMPEAMSVEFVCDTILKELTPRVIAFDRRDFRDDVIALARQAKKGIFVDRLGTDDNPTAWQDAIARGATGIQTDHPAELVSMLNR